MPHPQQIRTEMKHKLRSLFVLLNGVFTFLFTPLSFFTNVKQSSFGTKTDNEYCANSTCNYNSNRSDLILNHADLKLVFEFQAAISRYWLC